MTIRSTPHPWSFLVLVIAMLAATSAQAEIVTTTDGRQIELRPDGTYQMLITEPSTTYEPLEIDVFKAFPKDYMGQRISHVVIGNVRAIDLERGWTLVDIEPGRNTNKILDISALPRKTLIKLGTCQRCRFTLYGEVKDFVGRRGIGFKAHRIDME